MRASLPGGNSEREPPDPIPNSEVKLLSADGSVGFPHVRVGHCQASKSKALVVYSAGAFLCGSHMGKPRIVYVGFWSGPGRLVFE